MTKIPNKENNYAFIDGQNLYLGIKSLGWDLDYKRFAVYLKEKYAVGKTYLFLGYIKEQENLYKYLRDCGFEVIFKEIAKDGVGKPKGNVDVDLTLHAILKINEYEQAVLITSDGDFAPLVEHLLSVNKLKRLLSPQYKLCSWLLRKYAKNKVDYLSNAKEKLKKHP
jgi:uncharacterized LabA/DUF88 family protein